MSSQTTQPVSVQIKSHRYENLMEISPVGIFFTDARGNCLEVNRRWCEITGISSQEALGRGWVKALHPEDLERVARLWYESAQKNQPFHAEYRFLSPGGKTTWVLGDARAMTAADGSLEGYIGIITDISQTKKSYAALGRESQRLSTVIMQMPVILFAFDAEGRLCAWNREAERVTGYLKREIIGNPQAMELLFPDDAYRREMFRKYRQTGNYFLNWEWQLTGKDGRKKIIALSNISRDYPLAEWASWGVGVDMTAIRQTERTLRERVKELNCLYKLSIRSNHYNLDIDEFLQMAVQLLPPSLQYPDIACARIIYEDRLFQTPSFKITPWKIESHLYVRGKNTGCIEIYYLEEKPEEAEGPFLIEERMLLDELALQISRTIGHIQGRKDLELLNELSRKAGELENFAHTLSHDLKTPLTAIGGYAQFLQSQLEKARFTEVEMCAQKISDISSRMEHRLDQLLKLACIGKTIEPVEEVDLRVLVEEALELFEAKLSHEQIAVEIKGPFPRVLGDRLRLLEALENLLDNAIKYIGEAPNQITIGCRQQGHGPVLFIQDNGIGLDDPDREDIFQLFRRLSQKKSGAGIGLSIVRRIIEAHGGRIWVESEGRGRGACFCFTMGHVLDNP